MRGRSTTDAKLRALHTAESTRKIHAGPALRRKAARADPKDAKYKDDEVSPQQVDIFRRMKNYSKVFGYTLARLNRVLPANTFVLDKTNPVLYLQRSKLINSFSRMLTRMILRK